MKRFQMAAIAAILMFAPLAFAQTKASSSAEEEQFETGGGDEHADRGCPISKARNDSAGGEGIAQRHHGQT